MRVVVVSFFSSVNLGDLLISSTLAETLEAYGDVTRISYVGDPFRHSSIEDTAGSHALAPHRAWRDLLHRWANAVGADALRRRWTRSAPPAAWSEDPAVSTTLNQADLVVIGGGNMIFDTVPWTRSWERFDAAVESARARGIPVLAMCLGIGPFSTRAQQEQASRSLAKCDLISFRDRQSRELYQACSSRDNSILTVDPVFTLEPLAGPSNQLGTIAFNCVDTRLAGAGPLRARAHLRACARLVEGVLRDRPNRVALFSTDLNDYPLLEEIERIVDDPRCEVRLVSGRSDLIEIYDESVIVVASRMHALITAYTQGIPVVGLSWQAKVDAFFELIEDGDSVTAIDQLPSRSDEVVSRVRTKLDSLGPERDKIQRRLPYLRERYELNHELIRSALRMRDEYE